MSLSEKINVQDAKKVLSELKAYAEAKIAAKSQQNVVVPEEIPLASQPTIVSDHLAEESLLSQSGVNQQNAVANNPSDVQQTEMLDASVGMESVPSENNNMPEVGVGGVVDSNLPQSGSSLPQSGSSLPQSGSSLPQSDVSLPQGDSSISQNDGTQLTSQAPAIDASFSVPAIPEINIPSVDGGVVNGVTAPDMGVSEPANVGVQDGAVTSSDMLATNSVGSSSDVSATNFDVPVINSEGAATNLNENLGQGNLSQGGAFQGAEAAASPQSPQTADNFQTGYGVLESATLVGQDNSSLNGDVSLQDVPVAQPVPDVSDQQSVSPAQVTIDEVTEVPSDVNVVLPEGVTVEDANNQTLVVGPEAFTQTR